MYILIYNQLHEKAPFSMS